MGSTRLTSTGKVRVLVRADISVKVCESESLTRGNLATRQNEAPVDIVNCEAADKTLHGFMMETIKNTTLLLPWLLVLGNKNQLHGGSENLIHGPLCL